MQHKKQPKVKCLISKRPNDMPFGNSSGHNTIFLGGQWVYVKKIYIIFVLILFSTTFIRER